MKHRRAVLITLIVPTVAMGWAAYRQHNESISLHTELEHARAERAEWARLSADRDRLRALQIPSAELQALRADHAALLRLRAELDVLQRAAPSPR
jgi:hypothetical protein